MYKRKQTYIKTIIIIIKAVDIWLSYIQPWGEKKKNINITSDW